MCPSRWGHLDSHSPSLTVGSMPNHASPSCQCPHLAQSSAENLPLLPRIPFTSSFLFLSTFICSPCFFFFNFKILVLHFKPVGFLKWLTVWVRLLGGNHLTFPHPVTLGPFPPALGLSCLFFLHLALGFPEKPGQKGSDAGYSSDF